MEMRDEDIILALLYKVGNPISYTKLQKLAFLVEKESDITVNLNFVPYKYGPFSREVNEIIDKLQSDDKVIVAKTTVLADQNVGAKLVIISEMGKKIGEKVYESMEKEKRESLDDIVKRWGHEPLSSLLVYTYLTYPETTKNSLIKDEVLN